MESRGVGLHRRARSLFAIRGSHRPPPPKARSPLRRSSRLRFVRTDFFSQAGPQGLEYRTTTDEPNVRRDEVHLLEAICQPRVKVPSPQPTSSRRAPENLPSYCSVPAMTAMSFPARRRGRRLRTRFVGASLFRTGLCVRELRRLRRGCHVGTRFCVTASWPAHLSIHSQLRR